METNKFQNALKISRIIGIIICISLYMASVNAAIITSTNDGNWTATGTWDLGRAPADNDTVVVSAPDQVDVDCNCGIYTNMRVDVYGDLWFNNGKKINLDAAGTVQIYTGGTVDGGNGGSKIVINGTPVWDGGDGQINGPAYVEDGSTGFESGVLPIQLISFDAQHSGQTVMITWSTASEINNDYFTIERSTGSFDFKEIGTVYGAGNSSEIQDYDFVDTDPLLGVSYYRLKQTDYDGKFTYSDIVAVELDAGFYINENGPTLLLFPNPTTNENINVKLQGYDLKKEVLVAVLDQHGREFYSKVTITDNTGAVTVAIDTYNRLAAGLYLVIGSSDNSMDSDFLIITQ